MTKTKQDDEQVHRLTEIVVEEVSLVDRPANLQPFLIVKRDTSGTVEGEIVLDDDGNLVTAKAEAKQAPREGATNDELRELRQERSSKFGVEVLEANSNLSFPANFPTKLSLYADPVNLKFPVDTAGRANNARTRFKQFADNYENDSSKRVVHTRIVEAQLKFGAKPSIDPDDPLDKLLPAALRERAEEAAEKTDASKAGHDDFKTSLKAANANIAEAMKNVDDERVAIEKTDAAIADLRKAKTSYSKADKAPTGTKKAGAKMSAARFNKLKEAVEILLALRDSLAPAVKEGAGKSEKKKGDDGGDRTAKLDKATAAKIDSLVSTVTKLTKEVEGHERKLRQGVRKGKRRGVTSNALPVEKGQRSDDDDTTWPMDLNREQTRKNTPTHRSFFDR
jgi:hypothetical protein